MESISSMKMTLLSKQPATAKRARTCHHTMGPAYNGAEAGGRWPWGRENGAGEGRAARISDAGSEGRTARALALRLLARTINSTQPN